MNQIERRLAALEQQSDTAGPLLVFGEPTPQMQLEILDAERRGRMVLRWPVAPPPIERDPAGREHDV